VHPIPLYEIAAALSGAAIALWAWHRFVKPGRWMPGASAAVFAGWYAAWRAVIESVRHESRGSPLPGWGWQIVFAVIAIVAFVWLMRAGVKGTGVSGGTRRRSSAVA
jgi:prolipoprotein diacylglyceryltransferase